MNTCRTIWDNWRLIHQSDAVEEGDQASIKASNKAVEDASIDVNSGNEIAVFPEKEASVDNFCIESYLGDICEIEKDVEHCEITCDAMKSSDMTPAYSKRCLSVEDEFVFILKSIGEFEKKNENFVLWKNQV